MRINQHALPALAAQQIIQRRVQCLGFDVPQGHIDGGDGAHRDGAAFPIDTFIEIMPEVLNVTRILANQRRNAVGFKIGGNRSFPAIERGIAQTIDAGIGKDFERNKISARTADNDFGVGDFH
jgi:hypothetical protein